MNFIKILSIYAACAALFFAVGCKKDPCPAAMQAKIDAEIAEAKTKPADEREKACEQIAMNHKAHDGCKFEDAAADAKSKKFDVAEMEKNCKGE